MKTLQPFWALYQKHRAPLGLGILLALLTLLASIGLLTLSGWFLSASAVTALSVATYFNYMLPAASVRGLSLMRTGGRWAERVVSHDATFKLLTSLRKLFFDKLAPLIPGKIANIRDADLLNRITADVDAMDHLYLRLLSPLLAGFVAVVLCSAFVACFDLQLGILLGAILLLFLLALPVLFFHLGKPYGKTLTQTKSLLRIALLDWLQGHAELELFAASARYRSKIEQQEQALLAAQKKMNQISAFASGLLIASAGFSTILVLWLGANGVGSNVADPKLAMVVFATMASFELLQPLAGAFQFLSQTTQSAERLNEILHAQPAVSFTPSQNGAQAFSSCKLRFDDVSFSYPNAVQPALEKISFTLETGQKLAVLGKTGSGKSTLLKLITRAFDPSCGHIYLNDQPISAFSENVLRRSMSVVSQRVDILNCTLADNLRLAKPAASEQELLEILEKVGLSHLAAHGLDEWLGDGGRPLSGGEARRIGVARAILYDAPLLLLDEPTEGLDQHTEQQILQLLLEHAQHKTLLLITHRLALLEQMDNLLVLENGKLIESGNHAALMQNAGRYASFHQINQIDGENTFMESHCDHLSAKA
ncbi:MAG: heme ABC transporter ATP-binding protein/permease CydC [Enterovibrio sp.]